MSYFWHFYFVINTKKYLELKTKQNKQKFNILRYRNIKI